MGPTSVPSKDPPWLRGEPPRADPSWPDWASETITRVRTSLVTGELAWASRAGSTSGMHLHPSTRRWVRNLAALVVAAIILYLPARYAYFHYWNKPADYRALPWGPSYPSLPEAPIVFLTCAGCDYFNLYNQPESAALTVRPGTWCRILPEVLASPAAPSHSATRLECSFRPRLMAPFETVQGWLNADSPSAYSAP